MTMKTAMFNRLAFIYHCLQILGITAELSPVFRSKATSRVDETGKWGFDQVATSVQFPDIDTQSNVLPTFHQGIPQENSFQASFKIPKTEFKNRVSPLNKLVTQNIQNWVHSFFEVPCECGKERKYFRITGGEETQLNQYPWMASISRLTFDRTREHFCGGSLINNRYVVTAAHCVENYISNPQALVVTFGEHNLETSGEALKPESHFNVQAVYKHPQYNLLRSYEYDLALLKLDRAIDFVKDDYIRPICLPDRWMSLEEGNIVTTAGWGQETFGGVSSNVLKHVEVRVVNQEFCKSNYQRSFPKDSTSVLCAGNTINGGEDACQGDSGGPLMAFLNKRFYLVGLVSSGSGCGDKRYPGIYTNLANAQVRAFIDLSFIDISETQVTTCKSRAQFRDA